MTDIARRELFVVLGTTMAGCVSIPGKKDDDSGNESDGHDEHTETEKDEESETERLPDRSPLANPLPGLVDAENREAFADEKGLEYRDGEVKVEIELEPGGERPDEYLSEVFDAFHRLIIAWVKVDDLVDLALDDNVRRVQPATEPKPATPG